MNGNKWRTLAWNLDTGEKIEQHSGKNTEFDELVIGNNNSMWFHLEQMNEDEWWFSFTIDDNQRVHGNMYVVNGKRVFTVWDESIGKPSDPWERGN